MGEEDVRDESFRVRVDPRLAMPRKRSLTIAGHRTSITLEDAFWQALKAAAAEMNISAAALVSRIDASREPAGLSAAIRVYLLTRKEDKAGHGSSVERGSCSI